MRTINAPGIELKEIDKSGYSPSMTGTGCFIPLFSDKGEPYKPMEFTSRSAFEKYYGTPDNEAERYGYAAACEVLNQNGRLWCSRLPYDNAAFEKVVGVKYSLRREKDFKGLSVVYQTDLSGNPTDEIDASASGKWKKVHLGDPEINDAFVIYGGRNPVLYDLSAIDEYRTDEAKVPADTFLIVDTTNATYGRVKEDTRLGQKREVIGIVPVVTTAANALYAQSLIQLDLDEISAYESLKGNVLTSLVATSGDANLSIDGVEMTNGGLLEDDLVKLINTNDYFKNISSVTSLSIRICDTFEEIFEDRGLCEDKYKLYTTPGTSAYISSLDGYDVYGLNYAYQISALVKERRGWHVEFVEKPDVSLTGEALELLSNLNNWARDDRFIYKCYEDVSGVGIEIAKDAIQKDCIRRILGGDTVDCVICVDYVMGEGELSDDFKYIPYTKNYGDAEDRDNDYNRLLVDPDVKPGSIWTHDKKDGFVTTDPSKADFWGIISAESVSCDEQLLSSDSRYGVHGKNFDDSVPETLALDAANYFSTIQPAEDGGFEADHLKDIGVVVYRCYLDPAEGNKVSYEPVEAFCGSLCKDDRDPNTGVSKFIDTIVNTNSQYINFFSNCFTSTTSKKFYKDECDILIASPEMGAVLGLYSPMTKEDISISKSIYDGLNKAFEKVSDINKLQIDIVCDAGISNIASYLKAIFGDKGPYDLMITDDLGNSMLGMWKCKS